MKRLVIFASGSGTNAENIISFFQNKKSVKVTHVLTNNKDAKVIDRCNRLNINFLVFNKKDFYNSETILNFLKKEADFIILAGFLWKVPNTIITSFANKIINIHPALLPKYGGKGMYGVHIHKKVLENNENKTGITIHYVNEKYDDGAIIFQKEVLLDKDETLFSIQKKIHQLEMDNFPKVIEGLICK